MKGHEGAGDGGMKERWRERRRYYEIEREVEGSEGSWRRRDKKDGSEKRVKENGKGVVLW